MSIKTLIVSVFLVVIIGTLALLLLSDDRVSLGNTSGEENGILVDAEDTSTVLSDQSFVSANSTIRPGKLHAAASSNEVIAFTKFRPVAILSPASWTTGRDVLNLSFDAQITIPVTIWIVKGPFNDQKSRAEQHCIDVVAAWNAERMGVALSPGGCEVRDATAAQYASYLDFQCAEQAQMQTDIGKVPDRINIYFVNKVERYSVSSKWYGQSCGATDFVALGSKGNAALLVHEMGHNFSLKHTDDLPDFDETNYMHSDSTSRLYFTEGQLFRAHFSTAGGMSPASGLNDVYHARPGHPTRDCPYNATDEKCPAPSKRIWADGTFPPN
jgi:hypothetical protein